MNNRKESGSRDTRALSSGLHTMIVKIRLKHVTIISISPFHEGKSYQPEPIMQ